MQPLIPKENTVLQRGTRRLGTIHRDTVAAAATATEITRAMLIRARGGSRLEWRLSLIPLCTTQRSACVLDLKYILAVSFGRWAVYQITHAECSKHRKSKAQKQVRVLPSSQTKLTWGRTCHRCQTANPTWLHQLHAVGPSSRCFFVKFWKDSN